ncbi:DNA internalization-related competence protein ComEC/Rec2 [Pandoraea sp. NPDC087047]|uniref:DNA internalization-related competence protein ComEC/Rec2 n=1 Tax=Pandoraea sp. NPDC087047 TaxID=3364390 RepID=UPI0037FE2FCF
MRVVLLCWVAGIWWLQQASVLPAGRGFAVAVGVAGCVFVVGAVWAVAVAVASVDRRLGACGTDAGGLARGRGGRRERRGVFGVGDWRRRFAVLVLAVCAAIGGYAWAAFRAEARLSDSLPVRLEGQQVTVVGVVAGLPTSTQDGARFAFDVEQAFVAGKGCELASSGVTAMSPSGASGGRQETWADDAPCRSVRVPRHIELVWPGRLSFGERGGAGVDAGLKVGAASRDREALSSARRPRAGERWRFLVRLSAPRGFANWHGFDAELMALVRGIRATGYVRTSNGEGNAFREGRDDSRSRRLHAGPLLGYRFAAWRERLRDDFRTALGPSARYGGVLMALALGERGDIADADWQVFADTGVSHLLAISGLHVSLVAGAFAALVGVLWRRACYRRFSLPLWWPAPKAAAVAGLLAALAYGAIAGWGVPVRRAVGMVAILVFALLSGRFAAPSYVLAWALAVVVALDPWAVVTPGLWLSFGAVAALVMAGARREPLPSTGRERSGVGEGDVADSVVDGIGASAGARVGAGVGRRAEKGAYRESGHATARPDGRASSRDAPVDGSLAQGAIGRWRSALGERLAQAARAQYAVTIGLVPLTLAWFGAVPLLGPLANAVAIPVMTLFVTPLALASLLLPAGVAEWALAVAHTIVVWLADWLGWLAALPWAVWRAPVAPVWAQIAAVVGVIVCLMPLRQWMRGIGVRLWLIGIRLAGLALMGPAMLASSPRPDAGEFRVTMLDIGQGNAVLVETATRTLLFDTGPPLGRRGDAGRRVIVPYLRAHGVARLDRLVVSHAHDDHFGGALSVLRAFPSAEVFSSLPLGHRVRRAAKAHRTCLAGQHWTWDGVTFRFLHPDRATLREGWGGRAGPNTVSCVLRIANGRHSALLAADAEAPQERAMVARIGAALRSDILLVPHHGSLTSSTQAFVAAISPRHVVFQTGYRNRFGHPKAPVVARYRVAGARIWQNVTHGGIRFSSTPDGIEARAYREQYRRYWHAELPDTS